MQKFITTRDAKEFLVGRILAEAERKGASISEIERKMLYFSETAWTLPDMMEVSDKFDHEYDQARYEDKISNLVRSLVARASKEDRNELDSWNEAVRRLRTEDHCLLVMIDAAGAQTRGLWRWVLGR